MGNSKEALFDIESAIEVDNMKEDAWILSLKTNRKEKYPQAVNYFTQILHNNPTNYKALCFRANVKLLMENPEEALSDIETAIVIDSMKRDAWILSFKAHSNLGRKEEAEGDLRHFDDWKFTDSDDFADEGFKILVDRDTYYALQYSNDVAQWQALCQLCGTEYYNRWYNTARDWYNKYCNTKYNHKNTKAYFEKIYYMHKSKSDIDCVTCTSVCMYTKLSFCPQVI